MVGVMSWHWDFWGCSTPIHEGNTIGRAVAVGRFLVMWVGMIFFWLRAARQDQPGLRRARPLRSPPAWCRSAGSHCCSPAPVEALQICTIAPAKAGREF